MAEDKETGTSENGPDDDTGDKGVGAEDSNGKPGTDPQTSPAPEPTPDPTQQGADQGAPGKPFDFSTAITALTASAKARRDDADRHLKRSFTVAAVAVFALLLVVVGGETVVRRALDSLVPTEMQKTANAAERKAAEKAAIAARYKAELDQVEAGLAQVRVATQTRQDATRAIQAATDEANAARTVIETEQRESEALNARIAEMGAETEAIRDQIGLLKDRRGDLNKRMDQARAAYNAAEADRAKAVREAEAARARIRTLEGRANEVSQSRDNTAENVRQLEQELARLREDRVQKSRTVESLREQVRYAERAEVQLREQIDLRKVPPDSDEYRAVQSELQDLEARRFYLEQEFWNARRELEAIEEGDIPSLEKQIEDARARLSDRRSGASGVIDDLSVARSEADAAISLVAEREEQVRQTTVALENVQVDLDAIESEIATLTARLESMRQQRTDLAAKLRQSEDAMASARANLDAAEQRIRTASESRASAQPISRDEIASLEVAQEQLARDVEAANEEKNVAEDAAADAATRAQVTASETSVQSAITRGGAVFGAVGILILLIQIFVNTTRYHTRLADLYRAQSNALQASNGDIKAAEMLLERLSPIGVDFGKTPQSLYEKALGTIGDVAKSRTGG